MENIETNAIRVVRYASELKSIWDQFVCESKNGTFMLQRDYMDYHSDRFIDFSLIVYDGNGVVALLPASLHNDQLRSHGGLTYGGLIVNRKMTAQLNLLVFESIIYYLKEEGIKSLLYKRVPAIYYNYPSDEDLYSLFRIGATLVRRDISTAIYLPDKIRFSERRRRNVKKAVKSNLSFSETTDFNTYINLLADVLKKHDTKPVHTAGEIERLAQSYPDVIKLYAAFDGVEMMAGSLLFVTPNVVHAQYIANSEHGKSIGALDFVFDKLINEVYAEKKYFDFGISTEDDGKYLNEGLVEQKQEFGGRGIAYDHYLISID